MCSRCRLPPPPPALCRLFLQGIPSDKVDEAVEEKIEEMGLKQYADRPAGGYSGGNKRKLSVAVAMIGDPQVLCVRLGLRFL